MVASAQRAPHPAPSRLEPRLRELADVAIRLGVTSLAAEASALSRRIAGGRFYVACVGEFKRGKSTLLNALVGEDILPAGILPVTSVVTVVRYGPERHASVQLRDGASRTIPLENIAEYVAEEHNPENVKEVAAVEAFVPSDLLSSGMCLVDTPGIGSVFAGNTLATQAFVPQIDAALVVLGADPPISADELTLIDEVARQTDQLIFVLGKADRSSDAERQEARGFCERTIAARLNHPIEPMFEVSAVERLTRQDAPRDWSRLAARLAHLATQSGSQLVRAAEERGLRILGGRLLREITERESALQRPLEESSRRIEALRQCSADAERSLADLGWLLSSEQERLRRTFDEQQDAFLGRARAVARAELRASLRSAGPAGRSAFWNEGHRLAQEIFRRLVDTWRVEQEPVAERMYREASARFVHLANAFLERVAAVGGLPPEHVPRVLAEETGFRTKSRLYFTELLYATGRSPFRWLLDVLRPPKAFRRAAERHAEDYLGHLVATNARRVTSDLDERVLESRRRLEHDVTERLRDVHGVAERAFERAEIQRARGTEAVRTELEQLAASRHAIEALLRDVSPTSGEARS